ncbi:DUF7282 domain-containing protein [Halosimplex halobium]|uniref:DUF7282 domain-containing protein n=1 Tax=Halosimplex halobium TaxID=3396618 RepID=UPI003F56E3AF
MSGIASRRVVAALVIALALATPVAVATVQAHGNHVAADSQVTDDGTVLVEAVSSIRPGFVVLRADAGGRPGEPLGSVYVGRTPDLTYRTSVPVPLDESVWTGWEGNRTIWAVLHGDANGNEEFDYGTDLAVTNINPAASTRVTVRRSESGRASVLAAGFDPQPIDDGTITVRRADLPTAGHLVVYPTGGNRSVGSRSLPAGTHRNVTVPLNESFLAEQTRDFRVRVAAHRDRGDGVFGPSDPPVTAGDRVVDTYFAVAPENATDDRPLVNTPTVTTAPERSATDGPTAEGAAPGTGTDAPTSAPAGGPTDSAPTTDGTAGSGTGFGAALAALAVGFAALVAVVRSASQR